MTSDLLDALAAHDLPTASLQLPRNTLVAHEWSTLLEGVRVERLEGVLARAVADGALPTSAAQAHDAHEVHASAMGSALRLDRSLLQVISALRSAGVEARVLKGVAVAVLDHPEPAQRCYGDVDILVRPDDLASAVTALEALGRGRDLPERRPGFDRRFAKEVTAYLGDGNEVDIHRTIAAGVFGLDVRLDELWEGSTPFVLGSAALRALDRERRLIHACYNAVLGDSSPRRVALRDVVVLGDHPDLDVDETIRLCERWRGGAVVAAAVELVRRRFGLGGTGELRHWARTRSATARERLVLRSYRSMGGSNTLVLLTGAFGGTGVRSRVAYLATLVAPSSAYREARRASGRTDEWRQGAAELLGKARPW